MTLRVTQTASRLWRESIPWRVSVIVACASTGMLMIAPAKPPAPSPVKPNPAISGASYTTPANQVAAPPPSPFSTGVGAQPQTVPQQKPQPQKSDGLKIAPGLSGVEVDLQRSEKKPDQKQEFGTFRAQ